MGPQPARTRFAPSPTGLLHIGGVRTALFNKLYAMATGGAFILRVEDTDLKRSEPKFEAAMLEDLKWLGLAWDEGPGLAGGVGELGPYRQSERFAVYREYAAALLASGAAYRCYCSKERLEALRNEQTAAGKPPRYDGRCRGRQAAPDNDAPHTIRFHVKAGRVVFNDLVHGPMSFDTSSFGDFVVIGSDGAPSYNFAAALDDSTMRVTHVIRGDDHLSNTPRQLIILDALKLARPMYAHLPLIHGKDGSPLSKREAAFSVSLLRGEGFLPEAVLNAAARLGWSPGEGLLGLNEMAALFSIEKLSKSPSTFDAERLRGFNKTAMERLSPVEAAKLASVECNDEELLIKAVEAVKGGCHTLAELRRLAASIINGPSPDAAAAAPLNEPGALKVLETFAEEFLAAQDPLSSMVYEAAVKAVGTKTGEKGRRLFLPLRAALTGATEGAELKAIVEALGKRRVTERLAKIIERKGN